MKVYLLKDIERVGAAGEIIKVSDGYALNYLIPRKLAVQITPLNEADFAQRAKTLEKRQEVIATKTSLLAERIKSLELTIKRKVADDQKLYGAINASDVVDLLAHAGVVVSKSQIIFDKAIKTKGTHSVTVKLSQQLQPSFTLKVVAE